MEDVGDGGEADGRAGRDVDYRRAAH
jgi:hypothetical protein